MLLADSFTICQTAFTVIPSPHVFPDFVDPAEQPSSINCGCGEPVPQFGPNPIGNRNRPNVTSLANQINNGSMLFALLQMIQCQRHGFMPPQPTRK